MRPAAVAMLLLSAGPAQAAAWMQPAGTWQVIASVIATDAGHSFGGSGQASSATLFQRLLLQTDAEYGWNDHVTLFLRTETANVHVRDMAGDVTTVSNAFEGGVRYHLRDGLLLENDVVSAEAMARSAGAYNFSVSANGQAGGSAAGARLLYGAPFRLDGHDGFFNVEAGQRWLTRPRPDETVLDLTAGLWLGADSMVMLQSFNLVSGGARLPYTRFRSHKLQASYVWRWSPRLSLQAGAYFSPAGAHALQESGLVISLWQNI